jgi:hypothetical protein
MQQNRYEEAVGVYRRAISLDPNSITLHTNLCNALEMAGRLDEANLFSHYSILLKGWEERHNPSLAGVFRSTCDFDAQAQLGDLIGSCERHVEPEHLVGVFFNLRPLTEDLETDRRVSALHRKWGDEMIGRAKAHPLAAPATGAGKGPGSPSS